MSNMTYFNTTFRPALVYRKPYHGIPYVVLTSVALPVGLIGNILILIVYATHKPLRNPGNEFLVNLAIADLFICFIIDPLCLMGAFGGEEFFSTRTWLCESIACVCASVCICAYLSLTVLCFSRYILICYNHLHAAVSGTRYRNIIICIVIWFASFGYEVGNILGWGVHYNSHWCIWNTTPAYYKLIVSLGLIGAPILLVGYWTTQMVKKIHETKANLLSTSGVPSVQIWTKTANASRSILIIYAVFVCCLGPFAILLIVDLIQPKSREVHMWLAWLAHIRSSFSFFIYLVTYQQFRIGTIEKLKPVMSIFTRCRTSNSVQPATDNSNIPTMVEFLDNRPISHVSQVPHHRASDLQARDPIVID